MNNIDKLIDTFVTGDYFIIFLVITLMILVVLILALIKSREEYNDLLTSANNNKFDNKKEIPEYKDDMMEELSNLMAIDKNDIIDENKPLVKQIDVPSVKTYDDVINDYENSEEENAVISAEELEKRTKERLETLGTNENREAIEKYEEEQENKAIISYEQLLKNASNISLSYKDEKNVKGAPKIQKIEVNQKEVSTPEIYLEEEEFLKILKEFRISLQ